MLYNNIRRRPPTTETPTAAELIPYDTAAAFEVELAPAPVPVVVPDPVADPTPLLASAVVMQVYLPRMTWELDLAADRESKPEQSICCWD
jgi:hypothetical protein